MHQPCTIMSTLDPRDPRTIDALIGFHRARFGDARMEGEENGESGGESGSSGNEPEGKPAPWEKNGEEFDAEKAKTLITSLQRERDTERDARKKAEGKVKEHEDASLSETDRQTKDHEQAKADAARKGLLVDRYEVAEEVGLPLTWARRLVGDDRDALLEDAKKMKADLDEKSKGSPNPDPSQGGTGKSAGTSVSSAKEDYLERRRKR